MIWISHAPVGFILCMPYFIRFIYNFSYAWLLIIKEKSLLILCLPLMPFLSLLICLIKAVMAIILATCSFGMRQQLLIFHITLCASIQFSNNL